MREAVQSTDGLSAGGSLPSAWRALALLTFTVLVSSTNLRAQCPNNGQTKVIKPYEGTGFYFYKFLGESSFVYFLDGKTFSFNDKDDPGKTFVFIDDIAYEPLLVDRADMAAYVKSSKTIDILRAQAKHQQDYFKKIVPSIVITDYGPSARKNPDGSDGRLFYLWKKKNLHESKESATQYLVSTLVKDGVVVLSIMLTKESVSEEDVFLQIQKYTSHFDSLPADRCAKVLSAPTAP
jgi:hypothetical protein